jgi:sucrose-phosphate synthase
MPEARRVLADWNLPEPDVFVTSVGSEIYRAGLLDLAYADRIAEGWDVEAVTAALAEAAATPQLPIEQRAFKRSYLGDRDEALRLHRHLRRAGHDVRVIHSHGNLIDVLPARAGKAAAMAHVAEAYGLDLDACIACGDSGNDADMLRAAGVAILPANADADLADLPARPGLIRIARPHAHGVLDGLARIGLLVPVRLEAAE